MAESKNIIIGILILVIILLLASMAFRPMMYSSTYDTSDYQSWYMGPGMMNNPGYNYDYGSGMMNNPAYNYSYGNGMMGNMMMGNMMALYYSESKPITPDEAMRNMQSFAQQYGPDMEVDDVMVFSSNYYGVVKNTNSSQDIAEVLVDRYSGSAYPEPGPNMMWNTQYGAGRAQAEGVTYDLSDSQTLAEDFLTGYLPEAQILESHEMPGYYTFDFGKGGIEGMLSVNAYSGQIWVHTWHGPYLGDMNVTN